MKKIIVLTFAVLLICALSLSAQKKAETPAKPVNKGYKIAVLLHGAQPSDTLFLKAYEGNRSSIVSTVVVTSGGEAIFSDTTSLPVGMYSLQMNNAQQSLDFFISEGEPQHFRVAYAQVEGLSSAHFDGSTENEALADYMRYMKQQQYQMQALQNRMQRLMQVPDSAASISRQMGELYNEVKAKWTSIEQEYKGKLFALFISSIRDPEPVPFNPPAYPVPNIDSLEQAHYYNFFKEHFFDSFDFSSPDAANILKMPFYGNRLSTYVTQVVKPTKNEMQPSVDQLMKKVESNREIYKYTVSQLYNLLNEAPSPELNEVATYVGQTYVVDRPEMWDDTEYVEYMSDRLIKAKLNPIGAIATDLKLEDLSGNWISLHDVQAPFTVLYFFNPLCHSCAVITPQVYQLYEQYKSKGVKVFAVYVDHRRSDWTPYLTEKGFLDWINVWDPDEKGSAGVYDKYDVHAIPSIYLLDNSKKVIAKDLYFNELEMWMQQLFQETTVPATPQP